MRYIKYAFILLALFGTTSHADSSSSASSMPDANSAGAFVQDFYDWYAPMAYRQKNSLPWETAITLKSDLFSTRLSVALKRDKFSFANPDDSYTALDSDPFLNTYNPCEHYIVEKVVEYEKNFRVSMQAICDGKLRQKVVVWAEVTWKKDKWLLSNFYYPEGQDLFTMLKKLSKKRGSDTE